MNLSDSPTVRIGLFDTSLMSSIDLAASGGPTLQHLAARRVATGCQPPHNHRPGSELLSADDLFELFTERISRHTDREWRIGLRKSMRRPLNELSEVVEERRLYLKFHRRR
jgi:hypothetical protein